eukprot:1912772-Prymnesium_polylepis.1
MLGSSVGCMACIQPPASVESPVMLRRNRTAISGLAVGYQSASTHRSRLRVTTIDCGMMRTDRSWRFAARLPPSSAMPATAPIVKRSVATASDPDCVADGGTVSVSVSGELMS